MTEPPTGDPATDLEREADRLEHHLEQLDDHIHDAQKAAAARREEAMPEDEPKAPSAGDEPEATASSGAETGGSATATDDSAKDSTPGDGDDEASDSADDSTPGDGGERSDPVGSRMPGHASGGDD